MCCVKNFRHTQMCCVKILKNKIENDGVYASDIVDITKEAISPLGHLGWST